MILVQNHLRLLSGNKLWCLIFTCFCLSACSPRIRTGKSPKKPAGETTQEKKEEKKFTEAGITLMMPQLKYPVSIFHYADSRPALPLLLEKLRGSAQLH